MHRNHAVQPSNGNLNFEETMAQVPFRSQITGLGYVTLADLYPGLPESYSEKNKLFAAARNELWDEDRVTGPWDVAFVALINRQIEVLEKAKRMLRSGKFHIRFHGDEQDGAHYVNQFEILSDLPAVDEDDGD